MLLKNVSKIWHIDLNMPHTVTGEKGHEVVTRGERFKIFTHNDAVEVPDECAKMPFVKAHIEAGNLIIVAAMAASEDEETDEEHEALYQEAKELGVDCTRRWGVKKLQEAIEDALEE